MRPSTIVLVVIAIVGCAAGTWLVLAPRSSNSLQEASRASGFFKPPQDYKTSGGQQMKPRW